MIKKGVFLVLIAVLAGCGGLDYDTLGGHLRADNCPVASDYVSKNEKAYGRNAKLLFLLDSAQVNMLCGNYEKSNQFFHDAEDLAEDLWTKSITKEAAAFLLNDYTRPYSGEDYERALINLLSAVNYLILKQYDEALVECRRLDANLSIFNEKYDKKNVYKEDAFARYLSGMIYEAVGSTDDAYIDYYKAYRIFKDYRADYGTPMPEALVEDLARLAEATGRLDELKDIKDLRQDRLKPGEAKRLGKVVLIHMNGTAPLKEEDVLIIPTERGPISLAFPRMTARKPFCRQSFLTVEPEGGSERTVQAELVEDINAIALKNLEDRKGRIIAKTIARAVAKQVAISKVTEDESLRFLLNIVNLAIERADTRSWRTLPGEIYIARAFLPEGRYNVYAGGCGRRVKKGIVDVKAGKTEFLLYETMY